MSSMHDPVESPSRRTSTYEPAGPSRSRSLGRKVDRRHREIVPTSSGLSTGQLETVGFDRSPVSVRSCCRARLAHFRGRGGGSLRDWSAIALVVVVDLVTNDTVAHRRTHPRPVRRGVRCADRATSSHSASSPSPCAIALGGVDDIFGESDHVVRVSIVVGGCIGAALLTRRAPAAGGGARTDARRGPRTRSGSRSRWKPERWARGDGTCAPDASCGTSDWRRSTGSRPATFDGTLRDLCRHCSTPTTASGARRGARRDGARHAVAVRSSRRVGRRLGALARRARRARARRDRCDRRCHRRFDATSTRASAAKPSAARSSTANAARASLRSVRLARSGDFSELTLALVGRRHRRRGRGRRSSTTDAGARRRLRLVRVPRRRRAARSSPARTRAIRPA